MNNELIYLVCVDSGQYEDYYEHKIFATNNKEKANKWVEKCNNIIRNNEKRIHDFFIDHEEDDENDIKLPFMYDFIFYENPRAFVKEIEFRKYGNNN